MESGSPLRDTEAFRDHAIVEALPEEPEHLVFTESQSGDLEPRRGPPVEVGEERPVGALWVTIIHRQTTAFTRCRCAGSHLVFLNGRVHRVDPFGLRKPAYQPDVPTIQSVRSAYRLDVRIRQAPDGAIHRP